MQSFDPCIDNYIESAPDFAQPVMRHLRKLVHKICPQVCENMKWSTPSFEYKGLFCGFGAYKNYCMFGFWKASVMDDPYSLLTEHSDGIMGNFGKITSLEDLPEDSIIIFYLREGMRLNDEGIQLPAKPKSTVKKELVVPVELLNALNKNKVAQKIFNHFSYSNKKEYAEWIANAKTDSTRQKRIEQAIEWIAEGKIRNWKYLPKNN
jgi:uncharacterized protein YdeI (YjbR/CyaY-like superfamily)